MAQRTSSGFVAPLYAAGFTTAFGAHSIAAGLGAEQSALGGSLLTLGLLLAVYDVAEVILKPIFGTLSDRIGAKPVIIGGLLAFCLFSAVGIFMATPLGLGLVRLGQGAAASAFSPASSAAVARLAGSKNTGKFFGSYGSWKTLGYVLGPLLGAALIWAGGFAALFATMSIVSAVAALWVARAMPRLPIMPKQRYTLKDLAAQSTHPSFLVPTLALACATGALGTAIGFIPLVATDMQLDSSQAMILVSVLALASALIQPRVGKLRDQGKISTRRGMCVGLLASACGLFVVALSPGLPVLVLGAILVGVGIGITTPLGFSHLASTTPQERMGRTMGSAELGREAGDAGGPLLVGAVATAFGVGMGLSVLAIVLIVAALISLIWLKALSSQPVDNG
ncbi:MFS transporter [Arthrobacter sp. NIO-1057]|uniref:MFS transporter n=1 Tax=Arthrobacter sp. NIO-1057 TaxID=993071 RepID=UPI00071E2AFF|nr:MFS transporter [Arthrobacter sp. NIO-1057]KSU66411.1 MFS transporter [Arthrobacter sp. NIO-1057]SCC13556.1 Predicted arabinose efflux permease, MFS family [Arthrobacter sp. NIO-1057]